MTGAEEFISQIAPYIIKFAPSYHIAVVSPIIAQAVLESAYGTSELAVNACNYFGLKYRQGRCPTSTGIYEKTGSEQNADGSYTSSAMKWCKFPNMEYGVRGYFDFINIPNYSNLKGVTDPETYLQNIKADKYATSLNYVTNLMKVIEKYNLTQYDKKEVGKMSNSSLVSYTKISPNKTSPRNHAIDTITIHCMAGNLSVETCGNVFAPTSRQASSNYGIGSDGRIAMYVEEKDRSWCSSNAANDHRAVTIEVANDGGAETGWHVSDKAYAALIDLVTDICKRNGIKRLLWQGNKNLIGQIDKQNMTVHRWFAAKACPGEYLYSRHYDIAEKVNQRLNASTASESKAETTETLYRVRKSADDVKSQLGAYKNLQSAKELADKNAGYEVYDQNGTLVYTPSVATPAEPTNTFKPYQVKVKAKDLNIRKGAGTNTSKVGVMKPGVYTIVEEKAGKGATMWGKLKSGAGWISLDYATKI